MYMYRCAAGIELAAKDGVDWILHIDTDELVYPGGGPEYSIQRVLASVPADVDTIVFPNYESLPERDDVQDPFTEVGCCQPTVLTFMEAWRVMKRAAHHRLTACQQWPRSCKAVHSRVAVSTCKRRRAVLAIQILLLESQISRVPCVFTCTSLA